MSNKIINEPYEYPVIPGTEEWKQMHSHVTKLDVCQIPDEILKNMTTEALLRSVMEYPLLADMLSYDSIRLGYYAVCRDFNGLRELVKRENFLETVRRYEADENIDKTLRDGDGHKWIEAKALKIITGMSYLGMRIGDFYVTPQKVVYTPAGTSVIVLVDSDWTTHEISDGERYLKEMKEEYDRLYPNRREIGGATPVYNCHSYAWYGEGAENNYWLVNPGAYMTDGSYVKVSTYYIGDTIEYDDTTTAPPFRYVHSAISIGGSECNSKWGPTWLFRHEVEDCPYYSRSNSITHWRISLDYSRKLKGDSE